VQDERVGYVALAGTECPGNGGRNSAAHAACSGVLNEHDKWEGQGRPCQGVGTQPAHEETVEGDHAGNGKKIEDIRRRESQQCGEDRAFQKKFGASRDGGLRWAGCRRAWRKRDGLGAHRRSPLA
jgi:hypothetical protein